MDTTNNPNKVAGPAPAAAGISPPTFHVPPSDHGADSARAQLDSDVSRIYRNSFENLEELVRLHGQVELISRDGRLELRSAGVAVYGTSSLRSLVDTRMQIEADRVTSRLGVGETFSPTDVQLAKAQYAGAALTPGAVLGAGPRSGFFNKIKL